MWNTSVNIHCSLTRGLCGPRHKIIANYNSPAVLEHPRGSTYPRVHGGPHHYPMRSPFHFANLSLIQLTSPNSYRACACLRSLESHPISWKLQSNSLEMITRVSKQCHLRIYHHRRNYESNQNWFTVFTLPYLAALANTAETRQNICDAVCDKIIDRGTKHNLNLPLWSYIIHYKTHFPCVRILQLLLLLLLLSLSLLSWL